MMWTAKGNETSPPVFEQVPMGLDYFPQDFQKRKENCLVSSCDDHQDPALQQSVLDRNNSASSQQLPQRQKWNSRHRQDADPSGYYSGDSELDSVSMVSATTSEASTAMKEQGQERERTFD